MKIIKILCLFLIVLIGKLCEFNINAMETGLFSSNGAKLELMSEKLNNRKKGKLKNNNKLRKEFTEDKLSISNAPVDLDSKIEFK